MKVTEIPIGSSIILDVERSGIYFTLQSKVYDLEGDGILVYQPIDKVGQIKELYERDVVYIRCIKGNKVLQWVATTKKMVRQGSLELLYLESTSASENGNKRGAYRIPIEIDTKITNIKSLKELTIKSYDISQTGLGFYSTHVIAHNDVFDIILEDRGITIPLRIKVIRLVEKDNQNLYGAQIVKSDQQLRRYISDRQLEEMRKQHEFAKG